MIDEADGALAALLGAADLGPGSCEVIFDPPAPAWTEGRGDKRSLNLFLFDVTEHLESRVSDWRDVRDDNGRVVERQPPLRRYELAYLLTPWTSSVREDHKLLAAVLRHLVAFPAIPPEHLPGSLGALGYPVPLQVAIPGAGPSADVWDIWSALGTPPKAHLKIVVSVPLQLPVDRAVGPPITARQLVIAGGGAEPEPLHSPKRDDAAGAANETRHKDEPAGAGMPPRTGPAGRPRRLLTEVSKNKP